MDLRGTHVLLLRNNQLRGLAHDSLKGGDAGSIVFIILTITTKFGILLGEFEADLLGGVSVASKAIHLLQCGLHRKASH